MNELLLQYPLSACAVNVLVSPSFMDRGTVIVKGEMDDEGILSR